MELTTTKQPVHRWKAGESGNPNGRPVGARTRFSRGFLEDLAEVWSQEGRTATLATAKTAPSTFLAVCARLIPQNVELTLKETYGGLDPELLAVLEGIRQSLPDANSRSPADVLAYVKRAVEAYAATPVIEAEKADT
jgi:hypothetical protein